VAFHVTETPAVAGTALQQHGIPYKVNQVPEIGVTQLFFQDPDGFHIEIGTYPSASELESPPADMAES
jgi:hypothetical protein